MAVTGLVLGAGVLGATAGVWWVSRSAGFAAVGAGCAVVAALVPGAWLLASAVLVAVACAFERGDRR